VTRAERLRKVIPGAPDDLITSLAAKPAPEVRHPSRPLRRLTGDGEKVSEVIETGWSAVPEELPAAREGRALVDVLERARLSESPRERRQRVAEERAAADWAAGGREWENRSFMNRVLGRTEGATAGEVLQRFADVQERSGPGVSDLRRARQILEQHGLDHVLPPRISAVFDANMGALDSPRYQPDSDLPRDVELGRLQEELYENRAWMRRYALRHPGEVSRSRPFARRNAAASDVHCVECAKVGASPEESFLIHNDPKPGPVPDGPLPPVPDYGDVTRLVDAGYSLETARLAATPVICR
jgi:hypothetical protein